MHSQHCNRNPVILTVFGAKNCLAGLQQLSLLSWWDIDGLEGKAFIKTNDWGNEFSLAFSKD